MSEIHWREDVHRGMRIFLVLRELLPGSAHDMLWDLLERRLKDMKFVWNGFVTVPIVTLALDFQSVTEEVHDFSGPASGDLVQNLLGAIIHLRTIDKA